MSRRVLAIASGGGHWLELCRLLPAFEGLDVTYASVHANYAAQVPGHPFHVVRDVSRQNIWELAILLPQLLWLLLRTRPQVVVTTGSMPALFAIAIAKTLFRARTIWIDSIANVETLSSSGSVARRFADVWLTQWPALARPDGPACWGAVL